MTLIWDRSLVRLEFYLSQLSLFPNLRSKLHTRQSTGRPRIINCISHRFIINSSHLLHKYLLLYFSLPLLNLFVSPFFLFFFSSSIPLYILQNINNYVYVFLCLIAFYSWTKKKFVQPCMAFLNICLSSTIHIISNWPVF